MTCTVPGCERPHHARGLCGTHYWREYHHTWPKRSWPKQNAVARKRAELIEELTVLLDTDTPSNIARRLGYKTPEPLARRLQRAGRIDLARIFWRVATAEKSQADLKRRAVFS